MHSATIGEMFQHKHLFTSVKQRGWMANDLGLPIWHHVFIYIKSVVIYKHKNQQQRQDVAPLEHPGFMLGTPEFIKMA